MLKSTQRWLHCTAVGLAAAGLISLAGYLGTAQHLVQIRMQPDQALETFRVAENDPRFAALQRVANRDSRTRLNDMPDAYFRENWIADVAAYYAAHEPDDESPGPLESSDTASGWPTPSPQGLLQIAGSDAYTDGGVHLAIHFDDDANRVQSQGIDVVSSPDWAAIHQDAKTSAEQIEQRTDHKRRKTRRVVMMQTVSRFNPSAGLLAIAACIGCVAAFGYDRSTKHQRRIALSLRAANVVQIPSQWIAQPPVGMPALTTIWWFSSLIVLTTLTIVCLASLLQLASIV
ncbi:MAG: hypothetical protein AAFN70_05700 [Planctomycetota bacterium]